LRFQVNQVEGNILVLAKRDRYMRAQADPAKENDQGFG